MLNDIQSINDDPFFQPRNISKRDEEMEKIKQKKAKEKLELFIQIKSALQNIKLNYKNITYSSVHEKTFLEIFSKLDTTGKQITLLSFIDLYDEKGKIVAYFDLEQKTFRVLYPHICNLAENTFEIFGSIGAINVFFTEMLRKYFKIYTFNVSQY